MYIFHIGIKLELQCDMKGAYDIKCSNTDNIERLILLEVFEVPTLQRQKKIWRGCCGTTQQHAMHL